MIPGAFTYLAPTTLPDAIALLQEHGDDAKLLAGGHSLIPLMKLRLAQPPYLVDIGRIPNLAYIREGNGYLQIGAMTREADLEDSGWLRTRYPILHDTARVVGDPLVRNMATIGGNLAHADPANDHPATMLALRSQVVATGPTGVRTIAIDDFFTGLFQTSLQPTEILTEIRIPIPAPRSGGAYLKVERKVGDYATAAVAAQVSLDDTGRIATVGIGLTGVGLTAIRAAAAERYVRAQTPSEDVLRQTGNLAAQAAEPSADLRGSVEYKRALVKTLTVRALKLAIARAEGGGV
jgi:aerobic carbon-monoxide dehydrogenase medium subunit